MGSLITICTSASCITFSPAASLASTSTTAEECSASALHTPDKHDDKLDDSLAEAENGLNHHTGSDYACYDIILIIFITTSHKIY